MSTRKALAFSYLDRYSALGLFVITSMIIARLLTPAQVGVYSITMIMIGFVSPFRDFGASQYLIYEKELTTERVRSVWTVQLSLGLALALLIFSLRDVAANFYREPLISDIMVVVAVNSLCIPFGALTSAWLTRELRFDRLAIIRFSSNLIGSATSIILAWNGYGPISLAYGSLLTVLATALVATFYRPKHFPWLPGIREIRRVLGFGLSISGFTFANIAYLSVPELLLGYIQGMHATGLYGRAQGLVQLCERLIMDSVHSVALPAFTKLQKEKQELGGAFIYSVSMISVLGWTLLSYFAIMAYPIIILLYGDQWKDSVDLARLLCVAMCFRLIIALCPSMLIAAGRRWIVLLLATLNLLIQAALCLVGATLGLEELGMAVLAASAILTLFWLYVAHTIVGFSRRSFLASQWRSFLVTAVSMVAPVVTILIFGIRPTEIFLPLLISGVGMAAGFLLAVSQLQHPIWIEIRRIL